METGGRSSPWCCPWHRNPRERGHPLAKNKILIVDDDDDIRFGVREFLQTCGYEVLEADSFAAAGEVFRRSRPDAAILDYRLPDGDALQLLPALRAVDPDVPLIILTAHGSIDLAVRAVKEGAEHFVTKPVDLSALAVLLERVLENQRIRRRHLAGRSRGGQVTTDP